MCGGLVIVFVLGRGLGVVRPTEIATVAVEVIYRANVLGEEKVQGPVKCYTNLVQAGQLAQVNRPPQPPREEAREIETENARHAHAAANRRQ